MDSFMNMYNVTHNGIALGKHSAKTLATLHSKETLILEFNRVLSMRYFLNKAYYMHYILK